MTSKLEQAIRYLRSGDAAAGRELLIEVLKDQPKNDEAWVWMATAVDTDELRQECLQEALKYNPRNSTARAALAKLLQAQQVSATSQKDRYVVAPVIGRFLVLFVLLLSFPAQIPAIHFVLSYAALEDPLQTQRTVANVTDYRILSGRGGGYQLRYRFRVPGDSKWYSCNDLILLMREDLWCTVKPVAWENAQLQGNRIEVVYLATNPWLNRASAAIMDSTIGPFILWALILCFNILAIVEVARAWREHTRCKVAVQQREVCRLNYWRVKQV